MLSEMIQDFLEKSEKFCNFLYKYHSKNKFDFKKAVSECRCIKRLKQKMALKLKNLMYNFCKLFVIVSRINVYYFISKILNN